MNSQRRKSHLGREVLSCLLGLLIVVEAPLSFGADSKPIADVRATLNRMKGTKTSFCFAVENGAISGINENELVRTASVTKTLTTFWAVESLGPNYQFETRIHVQPSTHTVHIEGRRDPFFDRDRLFTLISDLNKKGVTQIDHLTFDNNFWVWPEATEFRYFGGGGGGGGKRGRVAGRARGRGRRHASLVEIPYVDRSPASAGREPAGKLKSPSAKFYESETHTRGSRAANPATFNDVLRVVFNASSWAPSVSSRYQRAASINPVAGLLPKPKMVTKSITQVSRDANPLKGRGGVYVFTVKSAPLRTYLKEMNIHSINPYAEELFFALGGRAAFVNYMEQRFHMGDEMKDVFSGSGVNLSNNAPRYDSMVSCASVVKTIRRLDQDLEKQGLDLSDVLMAPGHGEGSTWEDGSNSLVVKTGTMVAPTAAKNLAGVQETARGEVYFGIFIDKTTRRAAPSEVGAALNAFRRNYQGVPSKTRPFAFQPLGPWTHMQMIFPTTGSIPRG